ncbi:ketopantoate reductase family protein [Olsenella uli]|uniref:ketopantoate reductase family protein n=1 Tax=Olsenella uli TaxID=133926 RepID=UPI00195C4EEF|nr:2-dehydropantoate 2-reductase [Olsenella uli]MBM6675885.1 ketopantoate reductase family protein [Olsenella uli]
MAINRVAILGRGAVGLLYGTIAEKNLGPGAVEFVMDDVRYARHAGETPTVNGEPCRVPTIPASEATPVDLVILAIKAPGLPVALDTMERLVGPRTAVASLINGVTSEERVAERFGWERTVLSVAQGMDAVFLGTDMTYTHPGEVRLGPAPGTAPGVVDAVADLYERAGIPHVVEADIRRRMWVKLMLNVGINQTCMVYGGTYGSASEPGSEQNRCFVAAMREALAVARAEGVDVTEADLAQMARLIASLDPAGMPSMAQDRLNQKPTEVEEFSGTICRLAGRHGLLVPTNQWLYQRIRELENGFAAKGTHREIV